LRFRRRRPATAVHCRRAHAARDRSAMIDRGWGLAGSETRADQQARRRCQTASVPIRRASVAMRADGCRAQGVNPPGTSRRGRAMGSHPREALHGSGRNRQANGTDPADRWDIATLTGREPKASSAYGSLEPAGRVVRQIALKARRAAPSPRSGRPCAAPPPGS
jgi:hypothetical protein